MAAAGVSVAAIGATALALARWLIPRQARVWSFDKARDTVIVPAVSSDGESSQIPLSALDGLLIEDARVAPGVLGWLGLGFAARSLSLRMATGRLLTLAVEPLLWGSDELIPPRHAAAHPAPGAASVTASSGGESVRTMAADASPGAARPPVGGGELAVVTMPMQSARDASLAPSRLISVLLAFFATVSQDADESLAGVDVTIKTR